MILDLRSRIPELPERETQRFAEKYKLSSDYINILVSDLERANYFEKPAV